MRALILTAVVALGLMFGAGSASAQTLPPGCVQDGHDIVCTFTVARAANCPTIEMAEVTQYFTAPNICTRTYINRV